MVSQPICDSAATPPGVDSPFRGRRNPSFSGEVSQLSQLSQTTANSGS